MSDSTILLITNDDKFMSLFQRQYQEHVGGGGRIIVATTIDEACSLLSTLHPRLMVVHWTRESRRYDELDRLLWTSTVQARLVPILVIAERYRTDQATTMYRMGVTEYISRTHHLDQLGRVVSAYLPRIAAPAQQADPREPAGQPTKAWLSNPQPGSITSRAV
jgi:response regulator of citrate/malate metabolism